MTGLTDSDGAPGHSTPSLSWLIIERQERLAETVETLRAEHGWAAGCVFRYSADETIFSVFSRPAGTAVCIQSSPTPNWGASGGAVRGGQREGERQLPRARPGRRQLLLFGRLRPTYKRRCQVGYRSLRISRDRSAVTEAGDLEVQRGEPLH
jgi:hypothetical protein